jgi:hypothetical protein
MAESNPLGSFHPDKLFSGNLRQKDIAVQRLKKPVRWVDGQFSQIYPHLGNETTYEHKTAMLVRAQEIAIRYPVLSNETDLLTTGLWMIDQHDNGEEGVEHDFARSNPSYDQLLEKKAWIELQRYKRYLERVPNPHYIPHLLTIFDRYEQSGPPYDGHSEPSDKTALMVRILNNDQGSDVGLRYYFNYGSMGFSEPTPELRAHASASVDLIIGPAFQLMKHVSDPARTELTDYTYSLMQRFAQNGYRKEAEAGYQRFLDKSGEFILATAK